MDPEELANHYERISNRLLEGAVVPFLGAGVNLCDRPAGFAWHPDQRDFLPRGSELADFLAKQFLYPRTGRDLLQVSMYGELKEGRGRLYEELDFVFRKQYPVTTVHRFLAELPKPAPLARSPENRYPLLATTNYDDLIERAFDQERVRHPYDLIFYLPEGERRGSFWHEAPGQTPVRIPVGDANTYTYPLFEERPVILKIHGTINLVDENLEGYVISEDHYIDYLAEEPLERLLPSRVVTKLRKSHLWFLGYSLADWNFRVFLRRLRRSERDQHNGWAVKDAVRSDEKTYWDKQGVEVLAMTLQEYIPGVHAALLKFVADKANAAVTR
jgi:SIR2-like domain